MGREAMAALLSSVALIARRRRDVRSMQPAWSQSAAALLLVVGASAVVAMLLWYVGGCTWSELVPVQAIISVLIGI